MFSIALSKRFIAPKPGAEDMDVITKLLGGGKGFDRKAFNALPEEEKKEIRNAVMKFHDATGLGTSLQVRDGELLH